MFSVFVYVMAIRMRLSPERSREYVGDLASEAEEEQAAERSGQLAPGARSGSDGDRS